MSIESIDRLTNTLATSATVDDEALTQSQVVANCVPWLSTRVTDEDSDNYENYTVRASFNGSNLRAQCVGASAAGRALIAKSQVAEFDGTDIKVQGGTFTYSGAAGSTTVTIPEAVVTGNSFVKFSYYINGGTSPWINHVSVRCELTNTTTITFYKQFSVDIVITWWVVEATDGSFTTQPISGSITGASATDTITSVDMAKSFIIGSHTTTHGGDDLEAGTLGVRLTNGTTVTFDREGTSQQCDFSGWVVTFGASTNGDVQRGLEQMTGATASETITAVDLARTLVQLAGANGSFPGGRFTGVVSSSAPYGYATIELTNTTTIDFARFGSTETGDLYWEAIQWPEATQPRKRRFLVIS